MTRRIVSRVSLSVLLAGFPIIFTVGLSINLLVSRSLWAQVKDSQPAKDFQPVTESMLRNPAPGDWPNWRRTDNAWGYSPLNQINTQNVQRLQLAWSWAMDSTGAQEAVPLVHDGIMYLPNPHGVIQALDAATGDLLWEYRPKTAKPPGAVGDLNDLTASKETSPSTETRSSERRAMLISSQWTRGPASWRGTRRLPITNWDTDTLRGQSSFAAR